MSLSSTDFQLSSSSVDVSHS